MYVFSYFQINSLALHLAVSDDGFHWKPLNGNQPVLLGTVSSKTLRDPFIFRANDGIFHLLATDGWSSKSINHCFSPDLINWSDQEALPVMMNIPGTRNCWAPECFYDPEERIYQIFWSSTVSIDGPDNLQEHRIWFTTTHDFITLNQPQIFFDPGYNVIDATIIRNNGQYLLAFKDERGYNRPDIDYKGIRVCISDKASGPYGKISELITPKLTEGPTMFKQGGKIIMFYDHFLDNRYGASSSSDGYHWEVITDQIDFPEGARHGNVFVVEDPIGKNLINNYG